MSGGELTEKKIETNFFLVALVVLNQIQSSKMATTITMPNALNQALSEVAQQSMGAAAQALATKYEFDLEEAMRFLQLEDVKFVKKRGPSPKSKAEKDAAKAQKAAAKKEGAKAEKAAAKKAKSSSDEDAEKPKTKRGKTGYLMFAAEIRPEVKEELTEELDEGQKLLGKEVIKEIAIRWKALPQEEQDAWREQAKDAAADAAASLEAAELRDAQEEAYQASRCK